MGQLNLFDSIIAQLKKEIIDDIKPFFEDLKKSNQPITPNEYMSRKEVCKMLGINLSTLWVWTNKGKLKSYGIGNRVYYKRAEVDAAVIGLKK